MSDPKKTIQEANGYLRNAEKNMFSGKNTEAVEMLKKAEELTKEASLALPGDTGIKTLFTKIEKMKKDLERKGVKIAGGDNNEMPFEVQSHLSRIRALLISAGQQTYLLEQARKEVDSFYAKFAGPMSNIPEIKEINDHLTRFENEVKSKLAEENSAKAEKEKRKQENEELCQVWYEKLKTIPYFEGQTSLVNDLLNQKEVCKAAEETIKEYELINFPSEKSLMLETAEVDLRRRIKEFPEKYIESALSLSNDLKNKISGRHEFLKNDTEWESDPQKMPYFISQNELKEIEEGINEIRPLFIENPEVINEDLAELKELKALNDIRKNEKRKKIKLKPDSMTGDELSLIKEKAKSIVIAMYPNSIPLGISVIKPWENRRTENWADTTKTEWIIRITMETTSQVAAKIDEQTCKLFTIHIEKEKQADNTFGPLTGHIMYDDDMLEDNITKN